MTSDSRAIVQEVLLVFALAMGASLAFVGIGQAVPFVKENLHAFVAVLFLLLPAWALGRRGETLEDHGLHAHRLGRALLVAAAVAAVTFPPYAVGHHVYQTTFFQRAPSWAWSNYLAFPEGCQLPPPRETTLVVTCERDALRLRWRGPLEVEARGAGLVPSAGLGVRVTRAADLVAFAGTDAVVTVQVPPGGEAKLSARRGGKALAAEEIVVGDGSKSSEQPIALGRGWLWLVELVFAQLVAVALPEEVLYRGYFQDRLAAAFPRRRRVLGVDVSLAAIFWTSVLFALTHFFLDLNPARLAVFFPSLLFGWIRFSTPTLAGCIVYHAACNVLVRLLVVHY